MAYNSRYRDVGNNHDDDDDDDDDDHDDHDHDDTNIWTVMVRSSAMICDYSAFMDFWTVKDMEC